MTPALLGTAARVALPALMDYGRNIFAGKQAEQIGNYNENQSAQDRLKAQLMNEDPNAQMQRGADGAEQGKDRQQARSRNDLIFDNQIAQSNNRADLQNQMTAADQIIAANRGTQLANNYLEASNNQANASGNMANAILNRRAQSYQVSGLR